MPDMTVSMKRPISLVVSHHASPSEIKPHERSFSSWMTSLLEPQDDLCSRRMPVLRLAETACLMSRRSSLHRPTQLAAANRPSLCRNPISPALVFFDGDLWDTATKLRAQVGSSDQ